MTDRLIRGQEIPSLPVVTVDGGDDIAEIRDVVFDGTNHRLVGFTLNKRGWFRGRLKEQLPAAAVHAIGADAVIVKTEADVTETDNPEPLADDDSTVEVIGVRVLSAAGTDLGEVTDVVLSTTDQPEAVGYELHGSDGPVFVPIGAGLAVSGDNLLLPAEADDFMSNDLAGFGSAVAGYRETLEQT